MIALGIPLTGIKFITVNASVLPHSASARQVDDTLTHEFQPNRTSPVEVVVGAPARSAQVKALRAQISRLPEYRRSPRHSRPARITRCWLSHHHAAAQRRDQAARA